MEKILKNPKLNKIQKIDLSQNQLTEKSVRFLNKNKMKFKDTKIEKKIHLAFLKPLVSQRASARVFCKRKLSFRAVVMGTTMLLTTAAKSQ